MKKILLLALAAAAALGFLVKWGKLAGAVRSLESLVRPVVHKETVNYYAGVYKEDPLLIVAVMKVESNFVRKAKSPRGAVGLMQLMPATARDIADEIKMKDFDPGLLEDPETNIRFGVHYLSKLRREFGDHDAAVLAAYNGGRKNVKEWLKGKNPGQMTLADIQFEETRNFTEEVLFAYRWLKRFQKIRNRLLKTQP